MKGKDMGNFSMASIAAALALGTGVAGLAVQGCVACEGTGPSARWVSAFRSGDPKARTSGDVAPAFRYAGPSPGQDDDTSALPGTSGVTAAG